MIYSLRSDIYQSLLVALLIVAPFPAFAQEAPGSGGSKPQISADDGKIFVSTIFDGIFTPETMNALSGGAPVEFTYVFQIKRSRFLIWDETVAQVVMKRLLKYDTLKKNYLAWEKRDDSKPEDEITFAEELKKGGYTNTDNDSDKVNDPESVVEEGSTEKMDATAMDPLVFLSLEEMEEWMNSTGKIKFDSVGELEELGDYYGQVRLKVKSLNTSPPITYILFFIPYLDFDTGWLHSNPIQTLAKDKERDKDPGAAKINPSK